MYTQRFQFALKIERLRGKLNLRLFMLSRLLFHRWRYACTFCVIWTLVNKCNFNHAMKYPLAHAKCENSRSANFQELYYKGFTACIKEMTSELSFEYNWAMSLSVISSSQRAVFVEQLTASKRTNVGRREFKEAFGVDWLRFWHFNPYGK